MSKQKESYFIPYEESSYPEREKQAKILAQTHHLILPEDYTFKKCEAYIEPGKKCAQSAKWVRMTVDQNIDHPVEMAVCDEHKTENDWTVNPISVKGERNIAHKIGDVFYFLTVQDDVIGEFTVQVWINQSSGHISPMIIEEKPSDWLEKLRADAEKWGRKY